MQTYTLTWDEQEFVRRIATDRLAHAHRHGAKDYFEPEHIKQITRHLEGAATELAFCRVHGIDIRTITAAGPDAGFDFQVQGLRIDVKSTVYRTGKLMMLQGREIRADWFVLMVGRFPGPYRFAGGLPVDDVLRDENLEDHGYGPTYAVEQSRLRPIQRAPAGVQAALW